MTCGKYLEQLIFKLLLAVVITILAIYSFQSPVVQAAVDNNISLRLVDIDNNPVARVNLKACRVNASYVQAEGCSDINGMIALKLPPGQYYFTGDITGLNNNPDYTAGLKNYNMATLYFISKPVAIGGNSGIIVLAIDNASYINIADIAGSKGFQVHVSQKKLGIETNVRLGANHNSLRLYLPTRMQYTIQQVGALYLQWPIYAAPGLQFIISSS